MKNISHLIALALTLIPITASAYQKASTIEEAKSKAGDQGIVIVTYADGWDKHSRKTAERMMKSAEVTKALGDTVLLELPMPNVSTPEQNDERKKRFANIDLSFPNSYPAFIFYNKTGYRVAELCIPFHERKKPKAVAGRITEIMTAAARQRELLAKAEAATGAEKARLLGEAAAVPGVRKPDNVANRIRQADPDNKTGMYQVATLDPHGMAEASANAEDWLATLASTKKLLSNPHLSKEQRQQLCCICIGLLHRNGGIKHKKELKEMIDKMQAIDPESMLGKSAIDARRLWVKDLTLAEGWNPAVIPSDNTPVELLGKLPINEAGTYEVTFTFQSGNHAAHIAAVELYDGSKKVAEDRHAGSTGLKSSNNVYTLKVPAKVKKPKVFVTFNMPTERNSNGSITITKK